MSAWPAGFAGLGLFFTALAVVIVAVILWSISKYNQLVRLRNLVQESWRQIDVELQRRHDLIPNLVETVKGYAAHEASTLDAVTQARAVAAEPGASPATQAQHENMLTQALGRMFAVAEDYPDLKANRNFLELQHELTNTEDRLAAGRRFYNANVRTMNTKTEVFPSSIIASAFKFTREEYFEIEDPVVRQNPNVSF